MNQVVILVPKQRTELADRVHMMPRGTYRTRHPGCRTKGLRLFFDSRFVDYTRRY